MSMMMLKLFLLGALFGVAWSHVIRMEIPPEPHTTIPQILNYLPTKTKTEYLEVDVDHFSFTSSKKFKVRYLINDKYWKQGKPIFFYTGNEGAIELFAENTGFVWEIAPLYDAMVVFAEHRYYGKSLPFGADSYKNKTYFGYLTAEQALADYVDIITHIKGSTKGAASSPVIAFGGSYGGMLSAWIRQKYPNIVAGAIAASAPVLMFPGIEPLGCDGFSMVMTRAYALSSPKCPSIIRSSWNLIYKALPADLTKIFKLCSPLKSEKSLADWLNDAMTDMAMANYPYPTNFLAKLPAWPVKAFCDILVKNEHSVLEGLSKAAEVYYNTSGTAKCLNITESQSPSLDASGWDYQSCMEMVMPMCTTGKKDMFLPGEWSYKAFAAECRANYGVEPRPDWIVKQFWGNNVAKGASNILFSNGDLDPWSAGGITRSPNPKTLPVVVIKQGAHHLDLRASNPLDPPSVKSARKEEKKWISQWIKNWK